MKIKCNDGIVREFSVSVEYASKTRQSESRCQTCGIYFGAHDVKILKPQWKAHICDLSI